MADSTAEILTQLATLLRQNNALHGDQIALRPAAMADRLGVSERTLWSWRAKGFPVVTIEGTVLHPVAEARAWLSARIDTMAREVA